MKVIYNETPPNFEKIVAVFPAARKKGAIFTYGRKIYVPGGEELHPSLLEHEKIHASRQGRFPRTINQWWDEYLQDSTFRLREELLAHRREYQWWKDASRAERRIMLKQIAKRLSSELYGNIITFDQARRCIK